MDGPRERCGDLRRHAWVGWGGENFGLCAAQTESNFSISDTSGVNSKAASLQKSVGAVMLVSNQMQEVFIMLTYKKVLEVFKDYLAEDET